MKRRTRPPADAPESKEPKQHDKATASKDVPPSAKMRDVTAERLGKQISFLGGVRPPRDKGE